MIRKIYNLFTRIKFRSRILLRELSGKCIPINSYAYMDYSGKIEHSNWGDDINWYFLKDIIDGNLIPYFHSILTKRFNKKNYVVIGSTIDLLADENSVVWGAGIIDSKTEMLPAIKEFRAVRGPLTRAKLLNLGFECPAVYGDPALLLPLYYKPDIPEKYRLGIIPHYSDLEAVKSLFKDENDIKIIDLRNYVDWKEVIDQIVSCENIASSSLHGLIVSYAYNIPNVWVKFKEGEKRDHFKYNDFYASIGKSETPLFIISSADIANISQKLAEWERGYIDIKPLIQASPFKLNLNY